MSIKLETDKAVCNDAMGLCKKNSKKIDNIDRGGVMTRKERKQEDEEDQYSSSY